MPNPYRFKHNVELIRKQLKKGVDNIYDNLKDNKDMDFGGIISSIVTGIKDSINIIGKPSFQKRYAKKIPDVNDYNKNVREICNDLDNSYQQIDYTIENIKNTFNYNALSKNTLEEELSVLKKRAEKIKLYNNDAHKKSSKGTFIINEDFKTAENLDFDISDADIDNHNGTVSLKKDRSVNHVDADTKIKIIGESEGFAGNHHQVEADNVRDITVAKNQTTNSVKWCGEKNKHANRFEVVDNKPETWFEYELVNVPDSAKKKAEYYGFEWTLPGGKKVFWARDPKNGKLTLSIRITLTEAERINWIDINPYIPKFEGAKGAVVKSIKTAPKKNDVPESIYDREFINYRISEDNETDDSYLDADVIPGNNDFTGRGVFTFSPRRAKTVDITFEQNAPYNCLIGHKYYKRVAEIKVEEEGALFGWIGGDTWTEKINKRVSGPEVIYKENLIEKKDDNFFEDVGQAIIGGDITKTVLYDKIIEKIEVFDGKRWALGIRDIKINSFGFAEESQIVSNNYLVPGFIKKISINANEQIPKDFYDNKTSETAYEKKDDWIKYFVSLNDGDEWHRIGNSSSDIPNEIYVNSNIPEEIQNEKAKYINSENDSQLKFKAIMNRPLSLEDASLFSPILKNINIKLTTEFDTGDN